MSERVPTSTLGLDGKIALITGGVRGLGLEIARKLCACGAHVILNYVHSADRAEAALAELSELKGTCAALRGDVSDPVALQRMLDDIAADHGRLDLFVHNAATFQPMSALAADAAAFEREYRLALTPFLCGAPSLRTLMPSGGRIVAVSGNGATRVVPAYLAPGVAKAALEAMVRYLAVEMAPHGVAVNAVATGLLDKGADTTNREVIGMLAARTPGGRLTRPADVAAAVALLCTEEAGWVQGQVLTVDGGFALLA
jgi:enoyl-[acyl-carrier protein] reductase III